MLSGKYCPGEQPPTGSRATDENGGADIIMRWTRDDILERVQQLVALAKDAGLSMVQLAVAWVLQNENVASAIISASRPEQVQDNAAAAGVKLNDDLMTKIDEILDPVVERDPARTLDSSPKTREAVCPFLLRELKLRSSSAHATPRRAWARSRDRHYSVPCMCTFWPASLHLRGFSWPKRVGKLPCLSGTESGPEILRSSGQGHK